MAKNIEISLVANTRDFVKGTRDASSALDDVAGSLDDLAREAQTDGQRVEDALDGIGDEAKTQGDRAGDGIADGIEDGTREAESEVERLNRTFRELATEARTQSKKAGDDVGDELGRGFDRAKEGADEFKNEAASSAREAAASFSGSADDIGDVIQEVAANAFAGFGPLGAAAGIAAAVGLGTLFTAVNDNAEKSEERIQSMYDDMAESGSRYLSTQYLQAEAQAVIADRFEDVQKAAEALELPASTIAAAYAGHAESIAAVRDRTSEVVAEAEAQRNMTTEQIGKQNELLATVGGVVREIGAVGSATTEAESKFDLLNQTANRLGAPLGDAQAKLDGIKRGIEALPDRTLRLTVDATEYDQWVYNAKRGRVDIPISPRVAEWAAPGRGDVP